MWIGSTLPETVLLAIARSSRGSAASPSLAIELELIERTRDPVFKRLRERKSLPWHGILGPLVARRKGGGGRGGGRGHRGRAVKPPSEKFI